jgi:hypothetical protein
MNNYCRRNIGRPKERGDNSTLGGETSHTSLERLVFAAVGGDR